MVAALACVPQLTDTWQFGNYGFSPEAKGLDHRASSAQDKLLYVQAAYATPDTFLLVADRL
jgi:hypothetical protein